MFGTIRSVTIIGCLAIPPVIFGFAEQPKDEAKSAAASQKLVAKIQKSLAKDESLSAYSHSVNVTIENGIVTLKGMVKSDEQSQDIQAKAESFVIQATPLDRVHSVVVHNEILVAQN